MTKVWATLREHPLLVVIGLLALAYAVFGDELPSIDAEQLLDDLASGLGDLTYLVVSVLAYLETGAFVGLLFPGETFSSFPFVPTLEGQYIIKNVVLVAAAMAVGATVRGGGIVAEPGRDPEARYADPAGVAEGQTRPT